MTQQIPLFPSTTKPDDAAPATAVLRDWLLCRSEPPPSVAEMDDLQLVFHGERLGAPPGLVALARSEAMATLRRTFHARVLHDTLRARFPRARMRRLTVEEIEIGVEAHIDALHLATSFGLPPQMVRTTVLCPLEDAHSQGDQVVLHGLEGAETERTHRVWGFLCHVQLDLPRGWAAEHRKRGVAAPWERPPEGWRFSGHKRWLLREIDTNS